MKQKNDLNFTQAEIETKLHQFGQSFKTNSKLLLSSNLQNHKNSVTELALSFYMHPSIPRETPSLISSLTTVLFSRKSLLITPALTLSILFIVSLYQPSSPTSSDNIFNYTNLEAPTETSDLAQFNNDLNQEFSSFSSNDFGSYDADLFNNNTDEMELELYDFTNYQDEIS